MLETYLWLGAIAFSFTALFALVGYIIWHSID